MKKIYMLQWAGNGQLGSTAYLDKVKAEEIASSGNAKVTRFRKFLCSLTGVRAEWIVKEIPVIE